MSQHPENRVGQHFGNYRLISLLGQGGFAQVYLGVHMHLETLAAIKVLHKRLVERELEEFLAEARNVARLEHPNIVRVLEYDVENDTPYLVMNYAQGGTLRHHHLKGVPLPLTTIVPYVRQIADALQYAHDEKLIHRDVKPENMLLGINNKVLLSDFGIAVTAHHTDSRNPQKIVGTFAYMAPEQFQGQACEASDQYSLAVVVYEWLCGHRPFHGNPLVLLTQHLPSSPPSLHEKVPMLLPEVEQVVMIALAKDYKERFANVQAFATALAQASQLSTPHPPFSLIPTLRLNSPSPSVEDVTRPSPSLLPTVEANQMLQASNAVSPSGQLVQPRAKSNLSLSRHRKIQIQRRPLLIGLGGLATAIGSVAWLALTRRPSGGPISSTSAPTPTLIPTSIPTATSVPPPTTRIGPPLFTCFSTDKVTAVAWSPNGQYIASASYDKTVQIWDGISGHKKFRYDGHTDQVFTLAWSSDGQYIASAGKDKTVQVWSVADGSHVFTYRRHLKWVQAVAWLPTGTRIASAGNDTAVLIWDAMNGQNEFVYDGPPRFTIGQTAVDGHTAGVVDVAWSPSSPSPGQGRLIASASDDKTVQVWDAENGFQPIPPYISHTDEVWAVAWSPDGQYIASAGADKMVRVWNVANGTTIFTYRGHKASIASVAWSPDGKRIASASNDTTVHVWNATNGTHISIYPYHTKAVVAVAWSPDGNLIASGSEDGTTQVWKVPS